MVSVASASVSSHMKPVPDDHPASARPTDSSVHIPSSRAGSEAKHGPDPGRLHHRGHPAVHHEHLAVDPGRGRTGQVDH